MPLPENHLPLVQPAAGEDPAEPQKPGPTNTHTHKPLVHQAPPSADKKDKRRGPGELPPAA
jgi:hypothetical protein